MAGTGKPSLRVAVDIGGTFTDLAAFDQHTGERWFAKSSTTPEDPTRGIAACLEKLGRPGQSFEIFVHGTTLVINACLEKDGAKTALVTTEGFRDVLEIARGNRTESFNYLFRRHEPFVPREFRLQARERMAADGKPVQVLDEKHLLGVLEEAKRKGAESVAICFLHSYRNPDHEIRARDFLARRLKNVFISISVWLLALAQIPFVINFFWSLFFGRKTDENPWHATTLEWTAPSPPPHGNFAKAPVVYRGPYEYSAPGQRHDFWPQSMKEAN